MEWIEKYSDFDELKKSKLALFFKENKYVQIIKRILYWLYWGMLIAFVVLSLVIKEWVPAFIFFVFIWQRISSRKAIKNRYFLAFGFLIFVGGSLFLILHFIQGLNLSR